MRRRVDTQIMKITTIIIHHVCQEEVALDTEIIKPNQLSSGKETKWSVFAFKLFHNVTSIILYKQVFN